MLQSDLIRLHHTLQITNITIVDAVLGATHQALPTAVPLLQLLKKGTTYHELLLVAHRNGCSTAQLRELIGFLQISGGIERYRQLHTWPKAIIHMIRCTCMGIHEPALAYRYKASPFGLLKSMFSALKLLGFVGAITVVLLSQFLGWNFTFGSFVYVYTLFVLASSIYIHEASHLIMLRRYIAPSIIVRQGLRLGLLHHKLPAQKELSTSIAGPTSGMACCLLLAGISLYFCGILYTSISLVVGLIHLCGLLPWYGDGKSVRKALLEKRKVYV